MADDRWSLTYREGTQPQQIHTFYVFDGGSGDGHLHVNHWNGSQWQWVDQGAPPSTSVWTLPSAISYREDSHPQRIYAFIKGANDRLYVDFWDGSQWRWADQGVPPSGGIADLSAITYREGTAPQRIYAFVAGTNGHLYVNFWDGSQWRWADQGEPPSASVSGIAAITYREGTQPQRIYVFARGSNGHLYVNFWDGSQWRWADQGTPPSTSASGFPSAIAYKEGNQPQRIYAFIKGGNNHLYVNFWDGFQWRWADQGSAMHLVGLPSAITYNDGVQRIYTFMKQDRILSQGLAGDLFVNYWDGSQWQWANQGRP
jgi:hypothetical protein